MPTSHRLPLFCLILVILVGSWVRLAGLGDAELVNDELNHRFAAQAIAAGQGPLLPSGERYTRGLFLSRAIAISQQRFDDPELAARLPSAVMGILNLALMGLVAWLLAGPWAAVWASVLLAIYPEAVNQSRTARFYTTQLNFALVALLAGWYATRGHLYPAVRTLRDTAREWVWMVAAWAALLVAYRIQPTTLPVILAFSVWILAVAASDWHRDGRAAVRQSTALHTSIAGIFVGAILLAAGTAGPTLAEWWRRARSVASWVGYESGPVQFYYWDLTTTFPWIISLLPLLALLAIQRTPRLTLYLGAWFGIPLVVHSVLLAWKGTRYFLVPLPALFILGGLGASFAFGLLWNAVDRPTVTREPSRWRSPVRAGLVLAALWSIYTLPAFTSFRKVGSRVDMGRDWVITAEILAARPALAGLPWGSVDPLVSLHQWGRVDFGINSASDNARPPAPHHPVPRFPPAGPPPPHDFYTGVPLVITPDAIRGAYGHHSAVIIGVYGDSPTLVSPQLSETLSREAEELCEMRCGRLRLYLWRFQPDSSAHNDPE